MSSNSQALLIGSAAIAIALLAIFDIIPETAAQMLPLAMVPFIIRCRRNACAVRAR